MVKNQLGVWECYYEGRDIRDKELHPATFPISLAKRVMSLFSHKGELVVDPFVGSGTTLLTAQDLDRNAIGFDLQEKYVKLCEKRLASDNLFNKSQQIAICDDARNIAEYIEKETVSLIWTSPPYANLLNRKRKNKSRRNRDNAQLGKVEQYPRTQGTSERCPSRHMRLRWATFSRAYSHYLNQRLIVLSTFLICGGKISVSLFMLL